MYLEMPVRTDLPSYHFQHDLEGKTYDLEFNWNDRGGFWTMDLNDELGSPIITGVRVITDYPLLSDYRVDGVPPGVFIAYDTGGESKDAGVDDFGTRVLLIYRESTTVDEAV
jgi:hypothetical protein